MEATILLCDWAEAVNGKLYILGGGWSRMIASAPINIALAIKLGIPWDQANRQIPFKASLVTEDGHLVSLGEPPQQVQVEGAIEVGRPPGLPPGSTLDAILALRFPGLILAKGGYSWQFHAEGKEVGRVSFDVVESL